MSRLRTVTPAPLVLTCCWSLVTSCLEGFCLEKSCIVVRAADGPGTVEKASEELIVHVSYGNTSAYFRFLGFIIIKIHFKSAVVASCNELAVKWI